MGASRKKKTSAKSSPKPKEKSKKIPANEEIRQEWLRRVEAEYRSAAITQHTTLWLIQIGASPDLIEAGLQIVRDELVHAQMSHLVYQAAGGEGGPTLVRETLGLNRNERHPLELDAARAALGVFCLGETVAVPLFAELRRECTVGPAKKALDRVLRDEVRHRDFGWVLLSWLLEQPYAANIRELVNAELPDMFDKLRASYAPQSAKGALDSSPEERAWGLMARGRYGEVLERAVERDYVPRFQRLGFDARAAWQAKLPSET
jgi:hypothetical protein